MVDLAAKNGLHQIKKELFGLSSEDKPILDIPIGSTFFETDTWDEFKFSSDGWKKTKTNHISDRLKSLDVILCQVLDELKCINRQLSLITDTNVNIEGCG